MTANLQICCDTENVDTAVNGQDVRLAACRLGKATKFDFHRHGFAGDAFRFSIAPDLVSKRLQLTCGDIEVSGGPGALRSVAPVRGLNGGSFAGSPAEG